ncbi:hypothetical protein HNQ56_003304 [Anaerotaenia torta]|uniref:hypothetical protein n=1 Tax=Anaerotaenia torta TaxID=433293 RepID=UPI003D1DE37C
MKIIKGERSRHITLIMVLFLFLSLLSGCKKGVPHAEEGGKEETGKEMEDMMNQEDQSKKAEDTILHYILPEEFENRYIGDVHPFYDEKTSTWYMFYLATGGQFHSKLLTSQDGISWKPTELSIKSFMENYAVLGITEKDNRYYSYYGDYHTSVSEDLITWEYAGSSYQAYQDKEQFPGGSRDPFVAYDEDTGRFYSIAINYPKRVPSEGIFISNLAIGRTNSGSLEDWSKEAKPVFAENRDNHDPECPQLIKIGKRWYVFTSFYGYSNHGVGRMAYLIGDENVDPYTMDWTRKEINYLTSEDICAAQIAQKGDQFYLFGWLPKAYDGNFWGGHINLPTEIYQLEDGKLGARMAQDTTELIRGERYFTLEEGVDLTAENSFEFTAEKRSDLQIDFRMEESFSIEFTDKKVAVNITQKEGKKIAAVTFNHLILSEIEIDAQDLLEENTIRILTEADMLEIYINDKYYLPARIGVMMGKERVIVRSNKAGVTKADAFYLKTRSELQK